MKNKALVGTLLDVERRLRALVDPLSPDFHPSCSAAERLRAAEIIRPYMQSIQDKVEACRKVLAGEANARQESQCFGPLSSSGWLK